ncbi:MAG TPA: histidine kinase [Acidobacteriaceae bacterium]
MTSSWTSSLQARAQNVPRDNPGPAGPASQATGTYEGRGILRPAYVLCQLGGWGLWTLLYGGLSLAAMPHGPGVAARVFGSFGLSATYGIALSHWLFVSLQQWTKLRLPLLLLRLGSAILLCTLVMTAAIVLVNDRLLHLTGGHIRGQDAAVFLLNILLLFCVWTVCYALIHQARQRRLAEATRVALELSIREAQYRSLSAQVQPHFFFNSLNTIRALIYENPAEADRAITRLAALLRAGLQGNEQSERTLNEELLLVEDYLALEKLRFEDRLRVSIEIDPAAAEAGVPPMALQHLVENAMKHGIAHLPEGGEVEIRVMVDAPLLRLSVRNPLPAHSAMGTPAVPALTAGSGLRNTRERLRLLYGAQAALDLEPGAGHMTARMHLPFREIKAGASACEPC